MGCKASKASHKIQSIQYTFEKTKVSQLDEFFNKASALFEKAEIIRKRFIESAQEAYHRAGTYQLRTGRYLQTIRVLFWSASSNCQGQILRSGLKLIDDPPFISLSANGLEEEIQAIYLALRAHLDVVVESPGVLRSGIDMLSRMNSELMRIGSQIQTKKFAKIIPAFTHNAALFRTELVKMKKLYMMIKKTRKNIEKMMPKVRIIAKKADRIGVKANSKGIHKPLDIFEQYIMLPKRNIKNDLFLNIDDIEIDESIHEESDNMLDIDDMDSPRQTEHNNTKKTSKSFTLSPEKISSLTLDDDDEEEKDDRKKEKNNEIKFGEFSSPKKNASSKKASPNTSTLNTPKNKKLEDVKLTTSVNVNQNNSVMPLQSMAKDLKHFATFRANHLRISSKSISIPSQEGNSYASDLVASSAKKLQIDVPERKNLAIEQPTFLIGQGDFPRYKFSTPVREPISSGSTVQKMKSPLEREGFHLDSALRSRENKNIEDLIQEIKRINSESQPQQWQQQQLKKNHSWYGDENVEEDEAFKNAPGENSSIIQDFSGKMQNYLVNMKF